MRSFAASLASLAALLSLMLGCMESAALATLRLPIAAALPAGISAVEVHLDGRAHRFESPFPETLFIDVDAGAIDLVEVIGEGAGVAVLYGQTTGVLVAEDATVDVDLVLDPAGIARVFTIDSLGPEISIIAVPANPPPGTPTRYALPFESGAYSRVVPAGDYRIRAAVEVGFGAPEVDIGAVSVGVGAATNAELDLSGLDAFGDEF